MDQKKSFSFPSFLLYFGFFFACCTLFHVGKQGEPLSLSLLFAFMNAEFSFSFCAFLYALSALSDFSLRYLFLYIAQAAILFVSFFIKKKTDSPRPVYPFLGLFLSLALFVFFSPFSAYRLPNGLTFASNTVVQKAFFSGVIFLLSACFSVAVKALTKKLLRCRLKTDEILFSLLLFVACGVGVCRAISVTVYMGVFYFVLLLFSCVTKDASVCVCAFVLSLPPLFCAALSPERFFVYGVVLVFSAKGGRFVSVVAVMLVFFLYGYTDGLFALRSDFLLGETLSVLLPSLLFLLFPPSVIEKMQNKLLFYREKHLPRIAINRNRASVGEKLFEISGVFREIQATFAALSENNADESAKAFICNVTYEQTCKNCSSRASCAKRHVREGIAKLVEIGTAKGRVNLIDIPKELADICSDQSGMLYAVNAQLNEYKKYMLEAENAKDGRTLLAKQAQGVSEILKNLALEQSAPLLFKTDREKKLEIDLLKAGVVCSEILFSESEDSPLLSLIVFGKSNVKKIAAVCSSSLSMPLIISEKLTIGKDKYCVILRKKPLLDAAFGVASKKKTGEAASGDTYSVIKIDERRFMIALSDGMGSGEYARKISESTISLLESFYKAKMPSDLVLSTVNKLLTFNREETFACVDIAIVDLDTGVADVVKIGSPMGFILSDNTLKVLDGGSLPLGILDCLHPDISSYSLKENDVLLFLSDGITGAFPSSADLYETLKHLSATNPQTLAESLTEAAFDLYGGTAKDDMTALAVRIFKPL